MITNIERTDNNNVHLFGLLKRVDQQEKENEIGSHFPSEITMIMNLLNKQKHVMIYTAITIQ